MIKELIACVVVSTTVSTVAYYERKVGYESGVRATEAVIQSSIMNGSYFVFMDGSPYEVIQIKQKTGDVLIKYKAFMMKEVADATDRKNRSHPGATDITAVN